MSWYRNIGSSLWRRPSGELVKPGEIFEATDKEDGRIKKRPQYRARIVEVEAPAQRVEVVSSPPKKDVATSGDVALTETPEEVPKWVLDMAPDKYLKRYPKGPRSALARQLVKGAS